MPKVSTSKKQRSDTQYDPSSRKGDSGGNAKGTEVNDGSRKIPFGSGEMSGGKLHDNPVSWAEPRGEGTKYNKTTDMPVVKTTVVGSPGLR